MMLEQLYRSCASIMDWGQLSTKDVVDRIRLILPEAIQKEDQDITVFLQ